MNNIQFATGFVEGSKLKVVGVPPLEALGKSTENKLYNSR